MDGDTILQFLRTMNCLHLFYSTEILFLSVIYFYNKQYDLTNCKEYKI